MATKKCDLVVKVGEYQSNGVTKARWENIGAVMDDGNGGQYIFIKRTFNPAGAPFKEGSESILVSMFDSSPRQDQPQPQQPEPVDEIPF